MSGQLLLSQDDRAALIGMRKAGALADVNPRRLDQRNGAVIVTCSDGDQIPDVLEYHKRLCLQHRGTPRLHVVSLNGGAPLISPASPLSRGLPDGEVVVRHALKGLSAKKMTTMILKGHAPCLAVTLARLSAAETVRLVVEAKQHIMQHIMALPIGAFFAVSVACLFHVDWGSGRKRSYFIDEVRLGEWLKERVISG